MALAAVTTLAGCLGVRGWDGSNGVDPGSNQPGEVVSVEEGVRYYPACGNETLTHGGTTWYPFRPTTPDAWVTPSAVAAPAQGGLGGGLARVDLRVPLVAPPGPGDDTGTLTIYDNGIAYWTSDSGNLDTWLTTTRIEYTWVC